MPALEETVTVMPAPGVSTTPSQLVARVLIKCGPSAGAVQRYVQSKPLLELETVGTATPQVVPPSVETSTCLTDEAVVSELVPLTVTLVSAGTEDLSTGLATLETGFEATVVTEEAVAQTLQTMPVGAEIADALVPAPNAFTLKKYVAAGARPVRAIDPEDWVGVPGPNVFM